MRMLPRVLRALILYIAGCVVIGAVLAEVAFRPARLPISRRSEAQETAGRFGAVLRDISINASDGIKLDGWYARPSRFNGSTVIILHGVGDSRQGSLGLAALFLSKGYAVLLPDSRGLGTSAGIPSYGIKETADVREWYRWLNANDSGACVFGLGESMGAAILLSSVREVPFCAVVAESPFANFRQVAYLRVGQFVGTGTWLGKTILRPAIDLAFWDGLLTRGVWLPDASPQIAVAGSHVPILLIHGQADTNIPHEQSEMILARNPVCVTLWEVPDAGHCGARAAAGDEFDRRVLHWFSSHCHAVE